MEKSQWYIALDDKPLGPFTDENIQTMLKNRSIHFVDYIWSEEIGDWQRVFKVEKFNHLLPTKPSIKMDKENIDALSFENFEYFIEETKPPSVCSKIKERSEVKLKPEKDIGLQKVHQNNIVNRESSRKVLSEKKIEQPPRVIAFVADAIVHDNFKVYHGVIYGLSSKCILVACKNQYLPVARKLQIIISSNELKKIYTLEGHIDAVSKEKPIGYSIVIDKMPEELIKIANA